jgi:hypothetical protein
MKIYEGNISIMSVIAIKIGCKLNIRMPLQKSAPKEVLECNVSISPTIRKYFR